MGFAILNKFVVQLRSCSFCRYKKAVSVLCAGYCSEQKTTVNKAAADVVSAVQC